MISLIDSNQNAAMVSRLKALEPDARPLWGKMTAPQMLAHCRIPFACASGEQVSKRGLIGLLFGRFAKRKFIDSDAPFNRNSPTDPRFLVPSADDFEAERSRLIEAVLGFGKDGPLTAEPHPFFGKLESGDWDRLMWKHLDHHLRQFSV